MSNPRVIAAVTACLRNLLLQSVQPDPDLAGTQVTTHPPDQARPGAGSPNQLNLFLYLVTQDAALRNLSPPSWKPGDDIGYPRLALNLYYLLTAYGKDDDAAKPYSHLLLGRALSALNDHPVLGAAEIASALGAAPADGPGLQPERVRLTMQPLSLEELSKLWTALQTEYRLCAAIEASVVLIDSDRLRPAPLPVLRRGADDRGAIVLGSALPPFPTIDGFDMSIVELGDTLTASGRLLSGDAVQLTLISASLAAPVTVKASAGGSDESVAFVLPKNAALAPGVYQAMIAVTTGNATASSNSLPLLIAPTIVKGLPAKVKLDAKGNAQLTLSLLSAPTLDQSVQLIVGSQIIPAAPSAAATTDFTFTLANLQPKTTYFCRIRVDGADSSLLADRRASPPSFDLKRTVTIQ